MICNERMVNDDPRRFFVQGNHCLADKANRFAVDADLNHQRYSLLKVLFPGLEGRRIGLIGLIPDEIEAMALDAQSPAILDDSCQGPPRTTGERNPVAGPEPWRVSLGGAHR